MAKWLRSNVCNYAQQESGAFRHWHEEFKEAPSRPHRKLWEYSYIAQALHERGMLAPGRRGLGFGVGREPLVALFARYGCEVVATDLDAQRASEQGWVESGEHASDLEALNQKRICDPELFRQRVSSRIVNMNEIPHDLRNFNFLWSSCSLEHVGSIELGMQFILNAMDCLKPGGVAVHTTEYNLSSDVVTIDNNSTVLFRKRDIKELARRLAAAGYKIDLDLRVGNRIFDNFVDVPPYRHNPHLRLLLDGYITTSIGLIIHKRRAPSMVGSGRPLAGRVMHGVRRVLRRVARP